MSQSLSPGPAMGREPPSPGADRLIPGAFRAGRWGAPALRRRVRHLSRQADDVALGQARAMTSPDPENPQPRDIALEQETPEQAADLEAQSDPDDEVS